MDSQCFILDLPGQPPSDFAALLKNQPQTFQTILEAIPSGLSLVDLHGRIVYWNLAAARLTQIQRDQAVGKTCKEVFNCPNFERACPLAQGGKGPAAPLCVQVTLNAMGRPVHLQKTSNYICDADGRILGAIESLVDLTAQREAETALHEAKDLVESARKAKRHFMANMNHEIRTPLNAIMGLLELLLSETPTPSQQEYLRAARRSASLLMDLIDDILNFTIVDKGAVNLEVTGFSLSSIITSVIARQYDLAQNKQVVIHSHTDDDVPDNLMGDSGRLYQILKQLMGNSIKFTPRGEVAMRVSRVPTAIPGGQPETRKVVLHFTISDTGVGIPKDKLDAIFQALSQVDESATRTFGGLGIGLNIVHRLIVMMEGRIWMESDSGRGTTVHFILPFKSASSGDAGSAGATAQAGPPGALKASSDRPGEKNSILLLGPKDRPIHLAPAQLPAHWAERFQQVKTLWRSDRASAESLLIRLKAEAKTANQNSLETLLFRLLLAVRRDDTIQMEHFHSMIARKLESGEAVRGIARPGGGSHEDIDCRR
jgi:PAS domain S-box-containing protein